MNKIQDIEILKERLSKSQNDHELNLIDQTHDHLTFGSENMNISTSSKNVHYVATYNKIVKLPISLPFILGVIQIKGEVCPIWDLYTKIGSEVKAEETIKQIIIFKNDHFLLGIPTFKTSIISEVPKSSIQALEENDVKSFHSLFTEYYKVEEKSHLILNIQTLQNIRLR